MSCRLAATGLLFASLAALSTPLAGRPAPQPPAQETGDQVLRIDPLLLAQAAEVWALASGTDSLLWPGWSAAQTPLLIYLPGEQDVLINHPAPPPGFVRYGGTPSFPGWDVYLRDGETILSLDGQNTSREIAGTRCLVVADTLSNRRSQMEGRIAAGNGAGPLEFVELATDPYDQMALVVHEAFHVHQELKAPGKGANEFQLMSYPVLSVDNNTGFALEGEALAAAMVATEDRSLRKAALRWLGVRAWRRSLLAPGDVQYEDGIEFSEGLAKYMEHRLFDVLEGRTPGQPLHWAQGFHGYGDLSPQRANLRDMLLRNMRGEVNVNNAPYGTAPLRMRLYYSGMAIGVMLDRLGATWKEAAMEPTTSLTDLVVMALQPTGEELQGAITKALEGEDFRHWRKVKTRLAEAGAADLQQLVERIENGPDTTLVVDFSPLGLAGLPLSFTPFGIRVVDEARTIFGQIPLKAQPGEGFLMQQTRPSPLLQDSAAQRVSFQLQKRLGRDDLCQALGLKALPQGELRDVSLQLPGVDLELARSTLTWTDGRIVITLLPPG